MNNFETRPRKIDLKQIEKGIEIYNTLIDLKQIVENLQASNNQFIIDSHDIYLENTHIPNGHRLRISKNWKRDLEEEIFNQLVNGRLDEVKTFEDILIKLNILEKGYETITDIDAKIETVCKEESHDMVQKELEVLHAAITRGIEEARDEILGSLKESLSKDITDIRENTIGDLSGLNEYVLNALGNNITVIDALNFLFQLVVDLNTNINSLNTSLGDSRAHLINSYNVELPEPFILPPNLGQITTPRDDTEDLKSIADQIKYRKTLNKITDNDWGGEE